jgi:lambda repressor-like predicted transcriptional regulator
VKEFGELIDQGEAALITVGETTLRAALDTAALKAERRVAKELDMSVQDVGAAVREAAGEVS